MKMLSNAPPQYSQDLWKHFADTYFSLRVGLASLAFAMPLVLYLYGKLRHGLDLQPSMSAYFWAAAKDHCATFPMRTIFVGFLFAIGAGLYVYKGLTTLENYLLNAAGVCASLVAIYPERISLTEAASDQRVAKLFESCPAVKAWATLPLLPIHYLAAVTLFVLLAIVAWFCADKSLDSLPTDEARKKYRCAYRVIAIAMILFPIAGFAVAFLLGVASHKLFFIEAAGIWTFGAYWVVKTHELEASRLEREPEPALERARLRRGLAQIGSPPP